MGIPLYSQIVAQRIASEASDKKDDIQQGLSLSGGIYLVGVERYKQLFRHEIDQEFSEAKQLVSAYRGTNEDNAAERINSMVNAALTK